MRRFACAACVAAAVVLASAASVAGQSFTFLQSGFTQELYGTAPTFFGGVAFAPNADVWVDACFFSGSSLYRFSSTTTSVVNGTTVHDQVAGSPFPSNAGCGLTNHPDGTIYSNTGVGVVNIDASTGVPLRPPFGPPGNALGITVDPQSNRIVYVKSDCRFTPTCTIVSVDPVTQVASTFAVLPATDAEFVDGIFFDPSGNYLFMSTRAPAFRMTVVSRSGVIVQHVPMTAEPDGIAFHVNPTFVVTNNTNGTMTRFDFPSNNFAAVPVQSVFASGGFRGDLSQVAADGCLMLTQNGTRYDNGVTAAMNSLVRICPNFVPPPGVNPAPGRMTGGGSVVSAQAGRVTHGFELHCNIDNAPNNLEINSGGNHFSLETLTAAVCFDDASIDAGNPAAAFNTIAGSGGGRYNGVPGATVTFTFSDAGEPGRNDSAVIEIRDSSNTVVLSVSGHLANGNQQAHDQ